MARTKTIRRGDNPFEDNDPKYRENPRKRKETGSKKEVSLALSLTQPKSLLMPAGLALGGFIAASKIPQIVGMATPGITKLGVKAGIAYGGGMLISRFLGKTNGAMFALGASIDFLVEILNTYLFTTTPLSISGVGAFPSAHERRGYVPLSEIGDVGDLNNIEAYPTGEGYQM